MCCSLRLWCTSWGWFSSPLKQVGRAAFLLRHSGEGPLLSFPRV
jgi:hypothetical protein